MARSGMFLLGTDLSTAMEIKTSYFCGSYLSMLSFAVKDVLHGLHAPNQNTCTLAF